MSRRVARKEGGRGGGEVREREGKDEGGVAVGGAINHRRRGKCVRAERKEGEE